MNSSSGELCKLQKKRETKFVLVEKCVRCCIYMLFKMNGKSNYARSLVFGFRQL